MAVDLRLHPDMLAALQGVDYEVVRGKKHLRILVNGRQVAVTPPLSRVVEGQQLRNTVAAIKRFIRNQKEASR